MALASPARLIEEYYKILRSGYAETTFRALAGKGLLRKDYLNGDAGGGGVYYWTSREAAEAWYTPEWRSKAKAAFGAEPVITYYETYVTVDNLKGETIVRDRD